jgi:serine/threonine protein kinase
MVDALKELHDLGYLHQDVKPDNFRVHNNVVKILDFGLMMEFKPTGVHKELGRYGFQGTPYFGSINAMKGYTLSRRDDIESLCYTLIYMQDQQNFPWLNANSIEEIL